MTQVILGKTGLVTNKNGFGALPIQRISREESKTILLKAYEHGITFYDTARFYTDSEEKLGEAFGTLRSEIMIASKTASVTAEGFWKDLEITLRNLKTEYLDLYQFHNPAFCPLPGQENGLYEAMEQAKQQGKIRYIGITNHRLGVAREALESGLYETLQFPFSYLAGQQELDLVRMCEDKNIGFIAMKALSGGLITNAKAAYAYLGQFSGVLPIWGIQKEEELDDFLGFMKQEPEMTRELQDYIAREREQLSGDFCRGCGYCMPCPAGIEINNCARMSLLIRRSPSSLQLTEEVQNKMLRIEQCTNCGKCRIQCPYGLDTPELLKKNLKDYKEILQGKSY